MRKIAEIKIKKNVYKIDLNKFYDLSIPIDANKKSPSFYDKEPLKIHYYKDENNKTWRLEDGAACNIPVIKLNIHCGSTHSECRSHITKEDLNISEIVKDSFIPSILISVTPTNNIGDDTYHYDINDGDLIITRTILEKKFDKIFMFDDVKALIIRTLPNLEDEIVCKDYNSNHNAFFSNEAVKYLRLLGFKHLVVDLPSIDRFDDGESLGNHQIFWNLNEWPNNNTITELAFIKNEIKDGLYLISLNILNLNLDASPCRPIIYPILKQS